MGTDDRLLGDFIDAAVNDHATAKSMLAASSDLRQRRWLHGETALYFLGNY